MGNVKDESVADRKASLKEIAHKEHASLPQALLKSSGLGHVCLISPNQCPRIVTYYYPCKEPHVW